MLGTRIVGVQTACGVERFDRLLSQALASQRATAGEMVGSSVGGEFAGSLGILERSLELFEFDGELRGTPVGLEPCAATARGWNVRRNGFVVWAEGEKCLRPIPADVKSGKCGDDGLIAGRCTSVCPGTR